MTIDLLKKILFLDAATCAALFLAAMVFGAPISAALGLAPVYVAAAGWICLGAAALMAFTATRETPPALLVWLVVFLNIDWVIASVVVFEIEYASLTALGRFVILGQALGTFVYIVPEAMGARMLGKKTAAA